MTPAERLTVQEPAGKRPARAGSFLVYPQSVTLRRALFHVHRWVGIAVGLYVLLVTVSGSVIVYRLELWRLFATRTVLVTPRAHRLSDAQLLAAARADYAGIHFSGMQLHPARAPDRAVEISFLFGGRRVSPGRIDRLFDPYTGEDLGDPLGPEPAPIDWIVSLHENLLSGVTGRELNGAGAILLTLLCASGAVIWWPGSARWRRSLTLRRSVGWRRLTWDLHSMLGFWSFLLVLMWALTGIYLSFPNTFSSLLKLLWVQGAPTTVSHSAGRTIDWLVQLHLVRSFGPEMRACLAILGLAPAALFVTGMLMWWNRVLRRALARVLRGAVLPGAARGAIRTAVVRNSQS